MPIALVHPKGVEKQSRPVVFVRLGNTSTDNLAGFVLDLEDELLFVRVHFAWHDLIDFLGDICGVFPCEVPDLVIHFLISVVVDT